MMDLTQHKKFQRLFDGTLKMKSLVNWASLNISSLLLSIPTLPTYPHKIK